MLITSKTKISQKDGIYFGVDENERNRNEQKVADYLTGHKFSVKCFRVDFRSKKDFQPIAADAFDTFSSTKKYTEKYEIGKSV